MRNIRRPEVFEPLFKRFTDSAHPVSSKPIFVTQRDFICFLATLGFGTGVRKPLEGKTLELDGRVFDTHEQSRDILYLIGLASSRNAEILMPEREDEVVSIFEEFIVSGFYVLDRWMKECPDDYIGDQSILTALRREGYFGEIGLTIEQVLDDVEF
jgi:dnd system-associated protein 4